MTDWGRNVNKRNEIRKILEDASHKKGFTSDGEWDEWYENMYYEFGSDVLHLLDTLRDMYRGEFAEELLGVMDEG